MITKWSLGNFKSVRDTTELDFSRLTIFAGANSSGKSTWIQSILMVSQTLSHRIGTRSVVLNGALARLGQFDDLRTFDSADKSIHVGWECMPLRESELLDSVGPVYPVVPMRYVPRRVFPAVYAEELLSVACKLSFDTEESPTRRQKELTQLHPNLVSCSLKCISEEEEGRVESQARFKRSADFRAKEAEGSASLSASDPEGNALLDSLQYDIDLDSVSLDEVRESFPSAILQGCSLRHFLPERLTVRINAAEERARVIANYLQTGNSRYLRASQFAEQDLLIPPQVLSMLQGVVASVLSMPLFPEPLAPNFTVRDWTEFLRGCSPFQRHRITQEIQKIAVLPDLLVQTSVQSSQEQAFRLVPVPDELRHAVMYLDQFFATGISYLGPLRDEPKPVYPLPGSPDLTYVGLKGEYTAAVLDLYKYRYVENVAPVQFVNFTSRPETSSVSLLSAVTDWLQYLGVAESVATNDRGKLGHELRVKTVGVSQAHDLTHAGVGLSQVLPILVTCLLSRVDATLLIEQPELHLHPSVQSRLGDFFLSMALLGKQCIIETHSEYLINRLRFRIASAADDQPVAGLTKIYFVEKKGDASVIKDVAVNDYGAIQTWPDGFFDESQNEAEQIVKAAALKRKRRAQPPHAKRDD